MADDQDTHRPEGDEAEDEFGIDQRRMPFTAHLTELRGRLIICILTVGGTFLLFFLFFRKPLYAALTLPVREACEATGGRVKYEDLLVSRKPTAFFVTSAYLCLLAAVSLTIPVTIYEAWMFVAPGLKKRERRSIIPILSVGSLLFIAGALFAFFVVCRMALYFLMMDTASFEGPRLLWNISDTLKFLMLLIFVFGVAFEMPLVIVALTRFGVLNPEALARKRRHAIVVMFVIGALLTPPDVVTQLLLAGPLIVLLEISIRAARFFKPKKSRWEKWDEEWDAMDAADTWPPASPPEGTEPDGEGQYGEGNYGEDPYGPDHYGEGAGDPDAAEGPSDESQPHEESEEAGQPEDRPAGQTEPKAQGAEPPTPEEPQGDGPRAGDTKPSDPPSDDDLPPDGVMH